MVKEITIKIDWKFFTMLSLFVILISVIGVMAGEILLSLNDGVGEWFDTKNISRVNTNGKNLDEITSEYGGSPNTIIIDLGDGEKSYSAIIIEERMYVEPIKQPQINRDDLNCAYGDKICTYDNGTEVNFK